MWGDIALLASCVLASGPFPSNDFKKEEEEAEEEEEEEEDRS